METLKSLMVKNGDDKSNVFFLKVIIKADFLLLDVQVESILLTAWRSHFEPMQMVANFVTDVSGANWWPFGVVM